MHKKYCDVYILTDSLKVAQEIGSTMSEVPERLENLEIHSTHDKSHRLEGRGEQVAVSEQNASNQDLHALVSERDDFRQMVPDM